MKGCIGICVGTYSNEKEAGIYEFGLKGTKLELKRTITGIGNPSYLALSAQGDRLYAVMEEMEFRGEAGGGVAAFEKSGDGWCLLNMQGTKGTLPCHLLLDEQRGYLYAANYMSGSIGMFSITQEGAIGDLCDFIQHSGSGPNPARQEGPHAHYVGFSPDRSAILSVDLGSDWIRYYDVDAENAKLIARPKRDLHMPEGVGPRHFVWDAQQTGQLYVVCELTSEIIVVQEDGAGGKILQRISTLPEGAADSACAAIKMSKDGRFLYASNRGNDSIAVFSIDGEQGVRTLKCLQIADAAGKTPRDFLLLEDMVIVANQGSNRISVLKRDAGTGLIEDTGDFAECNAPVCVIRAEGVSC